MHLEQKLKKLPLSAILLFLSFLSRTLINDHAIKIFHSKMFRNVLILDIEDEIDFWMILQMQRKRIFAMNFLLGVAVKIGCRPIWIFEWLIGYSLKKSFNFWSHLLEWIKKSKIYLLVKSKIICNMKLSTNSHLFWT